MRLVHDVLIPSLLLLSVLSVSFAQEGKEQPAPAPAKEYAVLETTLGTFEFELYRSDAPRTVENFVKLAERKYFDGILFHRISKGFVIQSGDPTGSGSGGESIYGKMFEDELNPEAPSYKQGYVKGAVAMANKGRPGTNSSQFFVMLEEKSWMPKNYTIFGRVTKGMDVVEKIGNVEVIPRMGPNDGRPKVDVVLQKVTIRREAVKPPAEKIGT
jgi:cyclophilin family peptidyl-prolyl cis-trans isomerase